MFEAFSTSKWKWTWWFLLLACVSVVVFLLSGLFASLLSLSDGGPFYYTAALGLAGLAVGVIAAVVTLVVTMLHRHSPPAKPVV